MNKLLPAVVCAALASILLPSAHAQMFGGDDQARRQIVETRQELGTRIDVIGRGQLELANQNEMLRAEVAKLRGQIEVLTHELESLKQRQRDFYVDLDDRLRRIEQPGQLAASPGTETGSGGASAPAGSEAASYEAALGLLKGGQSTEALAAFKQFIVQFPRSPMMPGATFWAGNAALQAKEVAAAQNYFQTVLNNWPNDAIASDAMLGLANSQQLMGEARSAQETLRQIVARYPGSSAAQVATQRLSSTQR
jgi:tol-pal system protein YbgF